MFFRPRLALSLACTFGLFPVFASATAVQIFTPSPGATSLPITGKIGFAINGPVSYSAGGNTLTFTDAGRTFEIDQAGYNYGGSGFSNGTMLLSAGGFQGSEAPITINFLQGVSDVSFNAEDFGATSELFSFSAFNGNRLLGTFTQTGNDPASLAFIGVQATGGDVITSLILSDVNTNNILIGNIKFDNPSATVPPAVTPEPEALVLLGTGLCAVLALRNLRSEEDAA